MTVHRFRVFVGRGPMSLSDLETRINDWVSSNPEWTDDPVDHTLSEYYDINGNVIGYIVDVRFEQSETKDNLLQKLEDKLKDKVAWYRVGYEGCDDDSETPTACGWDVEPPEWTAKDATIPADIPNMQPA